MGTGHHHYLFKKVRAAYHAATGKTTERGQEVVRCFEMRGQIRSFVWVLAEPELIQPAQYLHLLHEISLIVDDIFDRDTRCRGQRSVHCMFGTIPAGSSAGWLSLHAMQAFADNPAIVHAILQCGKQIAQAEILQWKGRLYRRAIGTDVWVPRQFEMGEIFSAALD